MKQSILRRPIPILDFGMGHGAIVYYYPESTLNGNYFVCIFCSLPSAIAIGRAFKTPEQTIEHLVAHEEWGHDIPEDSYKKLESMR